MVAEVGLEPTSLSRVVLEATAYANFATQPYQLNLDYIYYCITISCICQDFIKIFLENLVKRSVTFFLITEHPCYYTRTHKTKLHLLDCDRTIQAQYRSCYEKP